MASAQSRYDHATELAARQPAEVKMAYLVNELKAWADANPPLKVLHSEFAGLLREMREQAQAAGEDRELELYPSDQFRNNAALLDLERRLVSAVEQARGGQTTWIASSGERIAVIRPIRARRTPR